MKKNLYTLLFNITAVFLLTIMLIVSPASADKNEQIRLASVPAEVGYIDFSYGLGIKAEPTAEVPESKLWWNDGRWWGVLFDPASQLNAIYWFDWGNKTWVKTATNVDSRKDDSDQVAVRFDALWDEASDKLYLASHIKIDNPSRVSSSENWAQLNRYSYNATSRTYELDADYPVTINRDKTETLVLDKDASGRLWVTYVSRIPVAQPAPQVYKVYVNFTNGTSLNDNNNWNTTPVDMSSTISPTGAVVAIDDVSSVIAFNDAFNDKVGIMWSNGLDGQFYFAEHDNSSAPASGWSVTPISISGVTLIANDHIKMVKNSAGEVFAVIKTNNTVSTDPLVGVLIRSTTGTFSFREVTNVSSVDTRPTMVLNESENKLYVYVSSNEAGGIICVNTIQLPGLQLTGGNCSTAANNGSHFIVSSIYTEIDNATTTKQNINDNTGLVVLASDDENGHVYLHNTQGSPLPVITSQSPVRGGTLIAPDVQVSVTFSHEMAPATINDSSFTVSGPGGDEPGTVEYNAATRTATFIGSGTPVDGATYTVTLSGDVEDLAGNSLNESDRSFDFTMEVGEIVYTTYLPFLGR